ncbi:MAG: ankyrin repeat domain-containing protein, partial [Gammaproteobacteria bacterium]|nr:ankyrin repeat domain-containing protein [Gammaproteobacteria bacterium]
HHYHNDDLKIIINDIQQNNLLGIELIQAAKQGQTNIIKKYLNNTIESTYISLALYMAAKEGHADCVKTLLQTQQVKTLSYFYRNALEDAVAAGHKQCLALLIKMDDEKNNQLLFENLLLLSIKRHQHEIFCLLLKNKTYKLNMTITVKILHAALLCDDEGMVDKILAQAAKKNKLQKILDRMSIYKIVSAAPQKSFSILMDYIFKYTNAIYENTFTAIAKTGNIACAQAFINYLNNKYACHETHHHQLIMRCMLAGFSSISPKNYFTQPFNLHSDMVKFQIDHYLEFSEINDLKKLIEHLFSIVYDNSLHTLYTLCEIPLTYLIRHEKIKSHPTWQEYCVELALAKALHHQEPYYLRLLLQNGIELNFSGTDIHWCCVNGTLIKLIPSATVQCLAWIGFAINEIQTFSPKAPLIKACLQQAASYSSFENEMFAFIYHSSYPTSLRILRAITRYLGNEAEFVKVKNLLTEKINFLENELHLVPMNHMANSMLHRSLNNYLTEEKKVAHQQRRFSV